jgi:hypothetical protein
VQCFPFVPLPPLRRTSGNNGSPVGGEHPFRGLFEEDGGDIVRECQGDPFGVLGVEANVGLAMESGGMRDAYFADGSSVLSVQPPTECGEVP